MKPKIAFSARHQNPYSTVKAIEEIAGQDFKYAELGFKNPDDILKRGEKIKKSLSKNGLELAAFHAPTPLLSQLDRKELFDWYQIFLGIAKDFNAPLIVFHADVVIEDKASKAGAYFDNSNEAKTLFVETITKIARIAKELGITVTVENSSPVKPSYFTHSDEIKAFFDKVKGEEIYLTLDTCHAEESGPSNALKFAKELKPYIRHLHLSNANNNYEHGHAPLNDGEIDFKKLLPVLFSNKELLSATLEVSGKCGEGIKESKRLIKSFIQ
jgi:sugar phosphate isomerase/epimerase